MPSSLPPLPSTGLLQGGWWGLVVLLVFMALLGVGWALLRHVQAKHKDKLPPAHQEQGVDKGILEKEAFFAVLERDWAIALRHGGGVGLLLLEVDRLRAFTQRSGAAAADVLLAALARQARGVLRAEDMLTRFDAAQLAVLLPCADPLGALDVADRLRVLVEGFSTPGLPEGMRLTASVGVAVLTPVAHNGPTALAEEAQAAVQEARRAGGNCVRAAAHPLVYVAQRG